MKLAASQSPFAQRMAERPMPESLLSDPSARFFNDPPEQIQMAFGGRPWFFSTGCYAVHRLGLLLGLGWELDRMRVASDPVEHHGTTITGVRIFAPVVGKAGSTAFRVDFTNWQRGEEDRATDPGTVRIVRSFSNVPLKELKEKYRETLGEAYV